MKEIIFPDKYADKETLTYDENLTCSDKTTRLKKNTSFVDSVVELSTAISKRKKKPRSWTL